VTLRQWLRGRVGNCGWTLVELLMVLAIVGILSSLTMLKMQDMIERARVAKAIGDIEAIQLELAGFEAGDDSLPGSLAGIGRAAYLDPWGRPYVYVKFDPSKGIAGQARKDRFLVPLNSTYDLYSSGKDGQSQSALTAKASLDDVIRANDGGFIGLAAHY
jgi:general secretion pathway protein G